MYCFILVHVYLDNFSIHFCLIGEQISTKKEELIKILDKFNIQVDNPVSLLNQETSRNFLHSTNSKTLYQVSMQIFWYPVDLPYPLSLNCLIGTEVTLDFQFEYCDKIEWYVCITLCGFKGSMSAIIHIWHCCRQQQV